MGSDEAICFISAVETPMEAEPKFSPFTGAGRRLDGKPLAYQPPPVSSSVSKDKQPSIANSSGKPSAGSSSQIAAHQSQGKLVFGSNASRASKETQKVFSVLAIFSYFSQFVYHH